MNKYPVIWIIMGVSGSGKTVLGRLWAQKLECDFLEGDRRHPLENVMKMHSNVPLNDENRYQWLQEIKDDLKRAVERNRETVITCSALKASYRQQLQFSERVQLIWIDLPKSKLKRRLSKRKNHYMSSEILGSQLKTFEPLTPKEDAIMIDGSNSPIEIVEELFSKARKKFPNIEKSWWYRSNVTD